MSAIVGAALSRLSRARRAREARSRTRVQLVVAGALLIAGLLVAGAPVQAHAARSLVIPEGVGSYLRAGGERWGYLYSGQRGLGGTVTKGTRSDTRKVTRTIEYGIGANERGLKFDAVAEHTVRYEVYVSGPSRGRIYRVYQPKVTFRRASGQMLMLWKLTVSLKSTIVSRADTASGGEVYRVKHQVTLKLPRQPLLPKSRWVELARQLAQASTGPYTRTVSIVPNGGWGTLVVGIE